ncbi:hypothetical protein [Cryobacterium sp. GrIS_2_6]|uniref:hypothetical protein n=1 Tax=Cryobacterium sp. GrIS_2_6 TaxID=3162785 RepID=UPI002DFC393E|nr:hypothetical protein [Cryobacterium psychrotolerans]MEC5149213.1 hypothetical protein [Cryobacterium psychrotolerans]MEC5149294.1 hypothetical protein [Cryobacterium psychrotolerans]
MQTLNQRIGARITRIVGTMWAAYLFTLLALVSLPAVIASGDSVILVAWIAQTLLQLVLLPVIIVGQNLQAAKVEARDAEHAAKVEARDIEMWTTIMRDSAENHAAASLERDEMTEILTDLREMVKAQA